MELVQKKMTAALSNFVNVLVEEGLEPMRLDLIRMENDFKDAVDEIKVALDEIKGSIPEDFGSSSDNKKFESLKTSIDNLALKMSEAFESKYPKGESVE